MQAAYESRSPQDRDALLREVYDALDAPLDERLRMLHAWLPPKPNDRSPWPWGERGMWEGACP